jgi:signal transduction histidine kinase
VPAQEAIGTPPGPLEELLDRIARRMGARRWVVCWQDRTEWVSHSAGETVKDEVIHRLAPKLAARPGVSVVRTADLGDLGARLDAAGVGRLTVLAGGTPDGGAVIAFENPDPDVVRAFLAGPGGRDLGGLPALCRQFLRAERWASDLFVYLDLIPHLAAVAFAGAGQHGPLQALGELTDHRSVLLLAPLLRGMSVVAVHREGREWRAFEETLVDASWEEAWEDPGAAVDRAARHIGLDAPGPWVAGQARAFQPRVILGFEPGKARPSPEGADMLAAVLSRTLAERRLAASVQQSTLAQERTRIASVIHEGLTQVLTNVAIQLEVLDQVSDDPDAAREMVRSARSAVLEALDSLRGAVFEMAPATPEWGDLATGLDRYVADYASQWGLDLTFEAQGESRDVPAELLALAYAFVQEGLTNLRKHAEASSGDVTLRFEPNWLSLSVCDPGVGFDPDGGRSVDFREHQGLALTRTRVTLMGGRFEVRSAKGKGTCIAMRVPA